VRALLPLLAALTLSAVPVLGQPAAPARVPATPRIIGASVLEALLTVREQRLTGVFAFVPSEHASMAMADYLMHDRRALKRFVKKDERDLEELRGIDAWDREVHLYLVGVHAQLLFPQGVKRIPEKLLQRIRRLSLSPGLSIEVMSQRRAARG